MRERPRKGLPQPAQVLSDETPLPTVPFPHDSPPLYDIECESFLLCSLDEAFILEGAPAPFGTEDVQGISLHVRERVAGDTYVARIARIHFLYASHFGVHGVSPLVVGRA